MRKLMQLTLLLVLSTGLASAQEGSGGGNPKVTLHTNKGEIQIELYRDQAPVTVENFLQYARDGFYDGTIFHRVISHFMIQGGGFTVDGQRKPTREPIENEADNGLKNLRGTVAMARTTEPHSATAQFFINVELNPNLDNKGTANSRDWGYAVFGHVIDGMDVVDDIRFVPTDNRDWPLEPVIIESVEIQ
jgi:cyclophilin family peptidyl-prolyl cis-trans isomerase